MTNWWADAVARAVAEGRTDVQFAVPDGKYPNDLFFITNSKNQIICLLCWTGEGWITKDEIFRVELRDV